MSRLWIITYDISDNARRRAVDHVLQAAGQRVQKSVFECMLTIEDLRGLRSKLQDTIDHESDSVRYYPLCSRCQNRVRWQGTGERPDTDAWHIL
ncbi:CRISPR-associated endonuclease Cas2 [Candidatus Igneacidithiobacillus taiwanensis]|uniref:CRISPR-associated endonuclease Cas2 n=1 Tax=Candidatus Igneacidithiobacillus taiwanensis TaxID=1945924 RepID=UPI003917498D